MVGRDFLLPKSIQNVGIDGLLRFAGKTGHRQKNSWICWDHSGRGNKSDDPLSPAYVPRLFSCVRTPGAPVKRKLDDDLLAYQRRAKRSRLFAEEHEPGTRDDETSDDETSVGVFFQTELTIAELNDLEEEKRHLDADVLDLKLKLTQAELKNAALKEKSQPSPAEFS